MPSRETKAGSDILWCAEPGCQNHVHLGGGEARRMTHLPDGWQYEQRRRGLMPICSSHYYGHGVPKAESDDS